MYYGTTFKGGGSGYLKSVFVLLYSVPDLQPFLSIQAIEQIDFHIYEPKMKSGLLYQKLLVAKCEKPWHKLK